MRFLLTNDDGVQSVFLHHLVRALLEAGHALVVAAPKTEQSWIGAAKSRNRPVEATRVELGLGCATWSIDGTPSDCVNIALEHLVSDAEQPDAVISGFNMGMNASLGFIIASGTIGGALEGALHGLPAAALSQDLSNAVFEKVKHGNGHIELELENSLRASALQAAKVLPGILGQTAHNSFTVHNLNFPYPCTSSTPVRRTVPAHVVVPRLFSPAADDGTHRMMFRYGEDHSPEGLLTDRAVLMAGDISHSVLDYRRLGGTL